MKFTLNFINGNEIIFDLSQSCTWWFVAHLNQSCIKNMRFFFVAVEFFLLSLLHGKDACQATWFDHEKNYFFEGNFSLMWSWK